MTGSEQTQEMIQANEFNETGNEAYNEKRYDDAISYYSKAIDLNPDDYTFYSNRSAAYAYREEYELSLKDAEKVVELRPGWGKGYSRRGAALFYLERYKEAKEAYEKGLEHDPDSEVMKRELENCIQKIKSPALSQPLSNPFAMPGVEDKLKSDPRTSERMKGDQNYQQLLNDLKRDPKSLGKRLESPEVLEILSILLGIEIKISEDDDGGNGGADGKEEQSVDAKEGQTLRAASDEDHSVDIEEVCDTEQTDAKEELAQETADTNKERDLEDHAGSTDTDSDADINDFDSVDDTNALKTSPAVASPVTKDDERSGNEDIYRMSSSPQPIGISQGTSSAQVPDHCCEANEDTNSRPSSLRSTEAQPDANQGHVGSMEDQTGYKEEHEHHAGTVDAFEESSKTENNRTDTNEYHSQKGIQVVDKYEESGTDEDDSEIELNDFDFNDDDNGHNVPPEVSCTVDVQLEEVQQPEDNTQEIVTCGDDDRLVSGSVTSSEKVDTQDLMMTDDNDTEEENKKDEEK